MCKLNKAKLLIKVINSIDLKAKIELDYCIFKMLKTIQNKSYLFL